MQCSSVQYSSVSFSVVQFGSSLPVRLRYSTEYCSVQYCTAQYSTVFYCIVQYSNVQLPALGLRCAPPISRRSCWQPWERVAYHCTVWYCALHFTLHCTALHTALYTVLYGTVQCIVYIVHMVVCRVYSKQCIEWWHTVCWSGTTCMF